MKRYQGITAIALTGLVGFGVISAPIAASASEEGKRNTTYALGAAALGLLLTQHNKLPGILAAGGGAYAYSQYNNDVQARHRYENGYGYDRRGDDQRFRQDDHNSDANRNNGYRYNENTNRNDHNRGDSNNRDNHGRNR